MERQLNRQNTAPAGAAAWNKTFSGPNATASAAGGGGGLLGRTAAPASTLSRPPALKPGAATSQLTGEQMALQAALNKAQQPQGQPLTPRAQYADGSDHGNSLQRPGTSSLRSVGGGRDGRSMSVRISAPAPSVTRPPTAANDMRASGGSGGASVLMSALMNRGPGAQEIVEYARYIGMDPISDVNLLWIAEEALTAALPEGWTEHTDASGNSFYFNASTGSSTWEHPLDEYYRSLFLKLKKILVENRAAGKVNQSSTLLQCAYRQHTARTAFRIRLGLYRLGQSANVVQAVYRGHAVRSRLREQRMREWLELETFSCSAIQATFRGHRVRRSLAHVRARWAVEQRLRKIVLLQSVWRGHQSRRKAREEAMYQAMEVDEYASSKIQSVFRGHKARLFVRATRLQREYDRVFKAAAKLQGTWRGHCDRCFARDLRSMLALHLQQHSALQLQRVYRGHIGRLLKRIRFFLVSATKVQAVWRGHVGRRQCSMKLRHYSAVLLQSVWRGHTGRCKFLVQSQVQYEGRLDSYCHACATVIGRVYRGHLIRRYVHDWVVAARAALALQRMVRGHQARGYVRQLNQTTDAALQLQAVVRGHASRAHVLRLKLHKAQSTRVLVLQRSWRGHWCRSCMLENLQRKFAALILQRRWRGHMVRRFVALTPLRKSKAHAHAACLQRMWRRHSCRHKVRYMFAQRILDVRATRLQRHWRGHAARGRLRHVLTIVFASVTVQCAIRCHLARRAVGASVQAYMQSCCCTAIQTMWRQRRARLLFRMQVRVVLLWHSSSSIQRVYRGHLQRLAFATALRTGCFTTVSDSSHDRAARRARDVKAAAERGAGARPVRTAGGVAARTHKAKAVSSGAAAEQVSEAHAAGHCLHRTPWPPAAAHALACLRLIRFPGPRISKRLGKQQKERGQLTNRILTGGRSGGESRGGATSSKNAAAEGTAAPDTGIAAIGISVIVNRRPSTAQLQSKDAARPVALLRVKGRGATKEEVAPAPAPAGSKTLIRQQKQQETTQEPPSQQEQLQQEQQQQHCQPVSQEQELASPPPPPHPPPPPPPAYSSTPDHTPAPASPIPVLQQVSVGTVAAVQGEYSDSSFIYEDNSGSESELKLGALERGDAAATWAGSNEEGDEALFSCAVCIQCAFRMFASRGRVLNCLQQKCALAIQRVWRGHSSRSNLFASLTAAAAPAPVLSLEHVGLTAASAEPLFSAAPVATTGTITSSPAAAAELQSDSAAAEHASHPPPLTLAAAARVADDDAPPLVAQGEHEYAALHVECDEAALNDMQAQPQQSEDSAYFDDEDASQAIAAAAPHAHRALEAFSILFSQIDYSLVDGFSYVSNDESCFTSQRLLQFCAQYLSDALGEEDALAVFRDMDADSDGRVFASDWAAYFNCVIAARGPLPLVAPQTDAGSPTNEDRRTAVLAAAADAGVELQEGDVSEELLVTLQQLQQELVHGAAHALHIHSTSASSEHQASDQASP